MQSWPSHDQEPICGVEDKVSDSGMVWVLIEGIVENGSELMSRFLEKPSAI